MKKGILAIIALGFIFVLAACGGTDNSDTDNTNADDTTEQSENNGTAEQGTEETATSNELSIKATNWEFDQAEYTVKAGEEVNISFASDEGMHGLAIDEFDVNIEGDGETSFTPDKPGEYKIYCSIPCGQGHSDMTSTLIVK
ncbi:cupredoxin domain-containing protein [Virgibacillus dakarensis]|uniref:cupredoxin domain-containing protein n=1 Tax=Virgibacillus dakarensis TaxID=1917889 RepID=UPI000B42E403|nr:cupredoxin domain-containing protein [Virgibacillus dakarensis]